MTTVYDVPADQLIPRVATELKGRPETGAARMGGVRQDRRT